MGEPVRRPVLITGAASGIGLKIAEILAADGYDLALADIVPANQTMEAAQRCLELGAKNLFGIQGNVAGYADCERMINQTAERFGGIYGLVNNAGITRDALLMRMSEEQFDSVMAVNLKSVYNMSKLALPYMTKAREGRIINISSVIGIYGNAGQSNYAASKAGVIGFTKSLAKEVGGRGITVNAVAPGYIKTPMTAGLPESAREKLDSHIALKRLGEPEDVAYAVSFLLSERAGYITSQTLGVDGGMTV